MPRETARHTQHWVRRLWSSDGRWWDAADSQEEGGVVGSAELGDLPGGESGKGGTRTKQIPSGRGGTWECRALQVKSSIFMAQSWARAKVLKQRFELWHSWYFDWVSLCLKGCLVHCRMCSRIPDLSVLDARRASNWDNPEHLWALSIVPLGKITPH